MTQKGNKKKKENKQLLKQQPHLGQDSTLS